MGPLGEVAKYSIKLIKKIQNEYIQSIAPRQDVTDAFNEHVQEWVKHTVWVDNCRSWYKDNETGRVNAVWSGSSLHYIELIKEPRWEDYEIIYQNKKNMWTFLGMGMALADVTPGADRAPYLSLDNIDPKWMAGYQTKENPDCKREADALTPGKPRPNKL
jgi:hypothetical protein